ncbi:O-acetyl-ADP-ribose deacetylase (regulator of RNase III), contains Macro domain [Abditibacterium utsteinense]|uniref:O-acetyl-ADP-ribose deacetylase (Regulator of RNase III), contains Macro domain n=1 Tax=Abditibacterium utsteinense TaxID=1960156 RepID=A0A2S8SP69_9BACT|nr:macro domain-containing protein [Abditibacterium utsteinense]PQV62574.1 O-acetyl-ADP-ribose deacetylase (regulator of RNase III), contains Macro domain [Abditibacterium utsteinense]
MKIHRTELEIVRGSVLEIEADAIINAANTAMRGGGALDGAFHRDAGPQLKRELETVAPRGAATAQVIVTPGFNLSQPWIFHVAGPIWAAMKAAECDELLAQSYRNCLEEAQKRGLESLAFPSLSTGVYSFPLERAAPIALGTALDFLWNNPQTSLRRVTFALYGGTEFHCFGQAFKRLELSHQANSAHETNS